MHCPMKYKGRNDYDIPENVERMPFAFPPIVVIGIFISHCSASCGVYELLDMVRKRRR